MNGFKQIRGDAEYIEQCKRLADDIMALIRSYENITVAAAVNAVGRVNHRLYEMKTLGDSTGENTKVR